MYLQHSYLLIELLCLLDNLLLILPAALGWRILLGLIAKVCCHNLHLSTWRRFSKSKVCIVKHLNGQVYTLGAEVHNQGIAFEVFLVVCVELDTGFASIDLFCDNTTLGKDGLDFLDIRIGGKVGDVNSRVLAFARLGYRLDLFGGDETTTFFLVGVVMLVPAALGLGHEYRILTSSPLT